jgi:Spherulation-specific family 4
MAGPDLTVVFEGSYETYETHSLGPAIASLERSITNRAGVACIMHSVPKAIAKWEMDDTVKELRKVADSIFITELSVDYYSSFGATWQQFLEEMDS